VLGKVVGVSTSLGKELAFIVVYVVEPLIPIDLTLKDFKIGTKPSCRGFCWLKKADV